MMQRSISLDEAVRFHGHLGPFLVLGLQIGHIAIKRLRAKKHFGIFVSVSGADKKPKSCLIDGLQLATGATFGKGNIEKISGKIIKVSIKNLENNKKIVFRLKKDLIEKLGCLKSHRQSEKLAHQLYKSQPDMLLVVSKR